MLYKSILNVVGVVVAVVVVMLVGCGGDDNPAGGSSGLEGDWLVEEFVGSDGSIRRVPDDRKVFYSFKSSQLWMIQFQKVGDFWIELVHITPGRYSIKGDSVCTSSDAGVECTKYSLVDDILGLSSSDSYTILAKRNDIAKFKLELGSNLKSQDYALRITAWVKPSADDEARIRFDELSCDDSREVYISNYSGAAWYTEGGNRLTLVALQCDRFEDEWGGCVSTSVVESVTLEYELTNGTLRLRPVGSTEWDVWTPSNFYSYSQSKAKTRRTVGGSARMWF